MHPMDSSQNQNETPYFGIMQNLDSPSEATRENSLQAQDPTVAEGDVTAGGSGEQSAEERNGETQAKVNETTITLEAILNRLEADNVTEWIEELVTKINARFNKRVPYGGWRKIVIAMNKSFNSNKSISEVKNLYNRIKNQQQSTENNNRENTWPEEVVRMVKNTEMFNRTKMVLLDNIDLYCYKEAPKNRTKKIYGPNVNNEVLEMMNCIITNGHIAERIQSIKQLNNVIYACQKTYDEVTDKPKQKSKWKESIIKKIEQTKENLQTLEKYKSDQETTKEVRRVCKKYSIHSNNQEKVQQVKDKMYEQIAVYEKKIRISETRIEFRKANKTFEFNRNNFYRQMEETKKEVSKDIDKGKTYEFWREVWDREENAEKHENLVETMEPIALNIDISEKRIKEMAENVVKYLHNWKAPGHDGVYNFYIKKITSLHQKMYTLIGQCVMNPSMIDEEFYSGVTYLLGKKEHTILPEELRPITCLPNMYKIVSKVVTNLLSEICELNNIISTNQMGTKRRCQGAKQQALINKALNMNNNNNLCTSWIDVKKAYDSVRHPYLIDCLEKLKIPECILEFIKRMLHHQKTTLFLNGEGIGKVNIENGIIQGDALSPFLFVIAMEPLSRTLNKNCDKVGLSEVGMKTNHLIFIDDIKLVASDSSTLVELCQHTNECLQQMGLKVNRQKSASNIENDKVFGEKIDDVEGYKYLGLLEDSRSVIKSENKEKIMEKIKERTEALCATKLNARNLFNALNEFAISTINYYIGLIDYKPEELREMDNMIKRILARHNITRNASNKERIYLSRNELGRGLQNIQDKAEIMLLKLHDYLDQKPDTRPIIEIEKKLVTQLGIIKEYVQTKYEMTENVVIKIKEVKQKQKEEKMNAIKEKKMHGILFENEENRIDVKQSSLWLKKGNISPQEEGMLCKLQDRNIFYENRMCPHCHQKRMSVDHLATSCGRMLNFDYKKRHNDIVRCIHFMFAKKYGLSKNKRLKNYKVENVVSNERVRIKSDLPILTENRIEHNKPDLLIHDLKTKEITIIEVGVTNKRDVSTVEVTKGRKYEFLAGELKMMFPGSKVTLIPVVLTWDGLVTRHHKRYMTQLGISDKLQAYIQAQTLKRTCESILVDARNNLGQPIDNEELERMFDEL